jgi:hypothetical protein
LTPPLLISFFVKKQKETMREYTLDFSENLGYDQISGARESITVPEHFPENDNLIKENQNFTYYVVVPSNVGDSEPDKKFSSAILLFHGLNERSWDKYRPWANYLADKTGKPVILFPISLHINRSPASWSNPREMQKLVNDHISKGGDPEDLSFFNYALSTRIAADPFRFYLAGRETVFNVSQLGNEIREGDHPLFEKSCKMDVFAYSIGALLSQVLFMSDPAGIFKESKLFMFCGGALFSEMNGSSKLIMDRRSFKMLNSYYRGVFVMDNGEKRRVGDDMEEAFITHIGYELNREKRVGFYKKNKDRIRIISLKKDTVIPTEGIKRALGGVWKSILTELDFPFKYSHEVPFPGDGQKVNLAEKNYWFENVFSRAALFLG